MCIKITSISANIHIVGTEVVEISNDSFLRTGKTASLICVGVGEPEVEISWSFKGTALVNTSLITIYQEVTEEGGKISSLHIHNLAESEAGLYTCNVSNGFTTDNATTHLAVRSKCSRLLTCITVTSSTNIQFPRHQRW
jgi:hypothetical protein